MNAVTRNESAALDAPTVEFELNGQAVKGRADEPIIEIARREGNCFYTPYHLCHFEVHNTVARAVLFHDGAIAPLGKPLVDVVATAEIDLKAGQVLDGMGYNMTYGQCENSDVVQTERVLPTGIAEGCRVRMDIPRDRVLTYDDVDLPENRLCDRLREEQNSRFFGKGNRE